MRKPVFGDFPPGPTQTEPGWTATEDGKRLETSDLGSRVIVL